VADLLDRVYDTLNRGAVLVGTALGVDMSDVALAPAKQDGPPFHIEEMLDGATGKPIYTVTDGAGTSCDCPSRADAERVLDALEGKALVMRGSRQQGSALPNRAASPKGDAQDDR
jgi:hypothetical protein